MFVVIFRARINQLDAEYSATAERMRNRALTEFGCVEFVAVAEAGQEVALSYWNTLEDIQRWKQDLEHQAAQAQGRERWYLDYSVEIADILRAYARQDVCQKKGFDADSETDLIL